MAHYVARFCAFSLGVLRRNALYLEHFVGYFNDFGLENLQTFLFFGIVFEIPCLQFLFGGIDIAGNLKTFSSYKENNLILNVHAHV